MNETTPEILNNRIESFKSFSDEAIMLLGDKKRYPDEDNQLQVLVDQLALVENISFDSTLCVDHFEEVYRSLIAQGVKNRARNHDIQFNARRIMVPDETEDSKYVWQNLSLQDNVSVEKSIINLAVEQAINESATQDSDLDKNITLDQMINSFLEDVLSKISSVTEDIPEPLIATPARRSFLSRILSVQHNDVIVIFEEKTEDITLSRQISHKVRRINNLLSAFLESPEIYIAEIFAPTITDEAEKKGLDLMDSVVSKFNVEALANSTSPVKDNIRDIRRPKVVQTLKDSGVGVDKPRATLKSINTTSAPEVYEPETSVIGDLPVESKITTETETPHKIAELSERLKSTELFTEGLVRVSLPWLNNGEESFTALKSVTVNGHKQFTIEAIQPGKLDKISEESRMKSPTSKDQANLYDVILAQIASVIASGIKPHEATNLKLMKTKPVAEFSKLNILRNIDVSPNAPRMYVAILPASEVLSSSDISKYLIGNDETIIIVLAETDKANQEQVISKFTGLSTIAVRNMGAGQV